MRKVVNWSYERASWQWDVLCILILAFIFLTPKEWFNKPKAIANSTPSIAVKAKNGIDD